MADNGTILVVDDEIKILEVVQSYLEKEGYRVFTAKTGNKRWISYAVYPFLWYCWI